MNQRGNLGDGIYIIQNVFIFAIGCFVALQIISAAAGALTGHYAAADTILNTYATQAPRVFDIWFVTLFIGAPLVSAALAYINNIPPFFYFLSVGYALLQIMLGKGLEIAYSAFTASGDYAVIAASMPMANYILSNYGLYSYLVLVIVALGTYAKLGLSNQYGNGGLV